jgi:hypothetical protein
VRGSSSIVDQVRHEQSRWEENQAEEEVEEEAVPLPRCNKWVHLGFGNVFYQVNYFHVV